MILHWGARMHETRFFQECESFDEVLVLRNKQLRLRGYHNRFFCGWEFSFDPLLDFLVAGSRADARTILAFKF